MDIKWTAGPGPAPLPYSKRAREALGVTDDDKPWAHPDPPMGASLGFDGEALREGRLRTNLFLVVMAIIIGIWVYRKYVKRDRNPFFFVAPTASEEAEVSEENTLIARDARLKRFEEQKVSFADIMAAATGEWRPDDDNDDNNDDDNDDNNDDDNDDDDGGGGGGGGGDGSPGGDGSATASEGLRRRVGNQGD